VGLFLEGVESEIVRLKVHVRFRTPDGGWTRPQEAIIDPGSPNCLIPHSAWGVAQHRILVSRPQSMGGIGGGITNAPFGEVTLVAEDEVTTSPPLTVRAFLFPDDSEPLLLGFEDFLTTTTLYCDYERRDAYLEFRLS
jgi:hypothetical protein